MNPAVPASGDELGARADAADNGAPGRRLEAFAATLERAGEEYLALRGVASLEMYRLAVEACPLHGPGCARVTCGMLREHVGWERADPAHLAATLLRTILPPIPSGSQSNRPRAEPC